MRMDAMDDFVDALMDIISDEGFLVGSAVICMAIALVFLLRDRTVRTALYVLVAGTNLTIQGMNFFKVIRWSIRDTKRRSPRRSTSI